MARGEASFCSVKKRGEKKEKKKLFPRHENEKGSALNIEYTT